MWKTEVRAVKHLLLNVESVCLQTKRGRNEKLRFYSDEMTFNNQITPFVYVPLNLVRSSNQPRIINTERSEYIYSNTSLIRPGPNPESGFRGAITTHIQPADGFLPTCTEKSEPSVWSNCVQTVIKFKKLNTSLLFQLWWSKWAFWPKKLHFIIHTAWTSYLIFTGICCFLYFLTAKFQDDLIVFVLFFVDLPLGLLLVPLKQITQNI